MPMNKPSFTRDAHRVERLQENYDEGLGRESVPTELREKLDTELLVVSDKKLKFLYQNALESYGADMKTKKIKEFNAANLTPTAKKSVRYFRFL